MTVNTIANQDNQDKANNIRQFFWSRQHLIHEALEGIRRNSQRPKGVMTDEWWLHWLIGVEKSCQMPSPYRYNQNIMLIWEGWKYRSATFKLAMPTTAFTQIKYR